jgi:hypothetical protein
MKCSASPYGDCPSTAEKREAPRENTSDFSPADSPLATSGARYRGLPRTLPVVLWVTSLHRAREIPKSVSLAMPSSVTRMFSGVTSPCTTPSWWDFANAAAIWQPIDPASSGVSRPPSVTIWARLREGTYSMMIQQVAPSSTKSKTPTMFGWCSRPALRASPMSRRAARSSSRRAHLTATRRSSRSSQASQTTPMPPLPMGSRKR